MYLYYRHIVRLCNSRWNQRAYTDSTKDHGVNQHMIFSSQEWELTNCSWDFTCYIVKTRRSHCFSNGIFGSSRIMWFHHIVCYNTAAYSTRIRQLFKMKEPYPCQILLYVGSALFCTKYQVTILLQDIILCQNRLMMGKVDFPEIRTSGWMSFTRSI